MPLDRIPCRGEDCTNTILPATASANDGFCAPCVQKRKRAQRDEFIRQNRRTVNLYEGITDPVDVIRILHTPRRTDPLVNLVPPPKSVEDLYASLDSAQANRMMQLAAEALRSGNTEFAEDIGKSLATLTDFSLDPMLETWLAENYYWPSVVFRNAGPVVRDRLLSVMSVINGTLNINHALCALAWIGDQRVCDEFLGWENSPPPWRAQLHVGPRRYAHVAGWEPTQNGRRDLYHKTCLAIQPVKAGETACELVVPLKDSSGDCPWCNLRLTSLLELNLAASEFSFLGFSGPTLPILTCEACSCFGAAFGKVDQAGVAHWSDKNLRPNRLPGKIASWRRGPWSGVQVRLTPRRAIHAVDWCMPVTTSQIGGLPSWVQDAAYPFCPECQRTMTFIAQLDNGHFPGNEGIYYAFLCTTCRITSTTYQQT